MQFGGIKAWNKRILHTGDFPTAPDEGKGQPVCNCEHSPDKHEPGCLFYSAPAWLDAAAREITGMFASLDGFPAISASAGQDLEIKVGAILARHAGAK
jgi:hypothetical protein